METIRLIPFTNKGRNRIIEANTNDWYVLATVQNVSFSDKDGPWLHVAPVGGLLSKSRWVHKHTDSDFEVKYD